VTSSIRLDPDDRNQKQGVRYHSTSGSIATFSDMESTSGSLAAYSLFKDCPSVSNSAFFSTNHRWPLCLTNSLWTGFNRLEPVITGFNDSSCLYMATASADFGYKSATIVNDSKCSVDESSRSRGEYLMHTTTVFLSTVWRATMQWCYNFTIFVVMCLRIAGHIYNVTWQKLMRKQENSTENRNQSSFTFTLATVFMHPSTMDMDICASTWRDSICHTVWKAGTTSDRLKRASLCVWKTNGPHCTAESAARNSRSESRVVCNEAVLWQQWPCDSNRHVVLL